MKRTIALVLALVMCLCLFAACGSNETPADTSKPTDTSKPDETKEPANEEPVDPITMRWATTLANEHPVTIGLNEMAESIKEATDGRIEVQIYAASALGSEAETTEMCQSGAIEAGVFGYSMFTDAYPIINAMVLPYTYDTMYDPINWLKGVGFETYFQDEFTDLTHLVVLGAQNNGFRNLTASKPVYSPDDLKGMNVRALTTVLGQAYVQGLGANPVAVAFSELYMSLQTNVVEGQENPLSTIYSSAFYEVQDYLMLTEHSVGFSLLCVNDAWWNALDADLQAILADEVAKAADNIMDKCANQEADYMTMLEEKGMTIIPKEELDVEAFSAGVDAALKEAFKDNPEWFDLRDEIVAWLDANG